MLVGTALFFGAFNLVGGFAYTYLKFDVLDHTTGTGVIPGPWLIVPLLGLLVIPISAAVGLLIAVLRWATTGRPRFLTSLAIGFVVSSLAFHAWVLNEIVLPPEYYA